MDAGDNLETEEIDKAEELNAFFSISFYRQSLFPDFHESWCS